LKSRFVGLILFSGIFLLLIGIALLLWNDHVELNKVKSGEHALFKSGDIRSISKLSVEPLGQALENLTSFVGRQSNSLILAKEYLQRRPMDPKGWIWASGFAQRQGNQQESLEYLKVAHGLSKRNAFILNEVLNRYLELGEIESAIDVSHDLSKANPSGFRRWFSVMSRVTSKDDYSNLVDRMIPKELPNHSKLDPDYYFSSALRVARLQRNDELADLLWNVMPYDYKKGSKEGFVYLQSVISRQNADKFISIWQDLSEEQVKVGEVVNHNFERNIPSVSPCFDSKKIPGVAWGRDETSYDGDHSLKVSFNGEENIEFSHARCVIAVESGRRYSLDGFWKGNDISTLSGVYLDIYSPGIKGFYARTDAKIGRWPWQKFSIEFNVPRGVELVIVRIRRKKTELLDSKVAGDMWIDSLNLRHISVI